MKHRIQNVIFIVAGLTAIALVVAALTHRLPSSKNIDVPFTSQAPAGDWSEPWQNACEETSLYMVSSFYKDDEIKRNEAIAQIRAILAVKNKKLAVSHDESLTTIIELINELDLPWSAHRIDDPSIDDLKQELADNHPVIVPVFAPLLASAGLYRGGPDYHVLVLTGYDDATQEFIVNDPAERAAGRRIDYKTFMSAIHDLDQKDYRAGKKAVLYTREDLAWPDWFSAFK